MTLSSIVFYRGLFLIPLYCQPLYGYMPLQASLLLALLRIGAYIGWTVATQFTARLGTRVKSYLFSACTVMGTVAFAIPATCGAGWRLVEAFDLNICGGGIGALTMLTMSVLSH